MEEENFQLKLKYMLSVGQKQGQKGGGGALLELYFSCFLHNEWLQTRLMMSDYSNSSTQSQEGS